MNKYEDALIVEVEQQRKRIAEFEAELAHLCDAALAATGGLRRRIAKLEAECDALKGLLRDVLAEYQCQSWLIPTERRIKAVLAAKEE